MNNVVEYIIKARDLTKAGIQSAISGVNKFTAACNQSTAGLASVAKKSLAVATAVGGAFGMMDGAVGQLARGISGVASAAMAFGPLGAAVAAAQMAISMFAAEAQKDCERLKKAAADMAAQVARSFDRTIKEITNGFQSGLEAASKAADILAHKFDTLASKRAGLARAGSRGNSVSGDARLIDMERQASISEANAKDDEKGIVSAEWKLKIAKERVKIQQQANADDAAARAQAIKDDEERIKLAKRAQADQEAIAERLRARLNQAIDVRDSAGINPLDEDEKSNQLIEKLRGQLKQAESAADAQAQRAEDLQAKVDVARADSAVDEAAAANKMSQAANAVLNAEHALSDAEQDFTDKQKAEIEQASRELQLMREKDEADRIAAEKRIHNIKLQNAKNELAASEQAENEAQGRLAQAQAKVAQAWGWYRDKNSMQAAIDDFKAQQAAEKQWATDFDKLKARRSDWRTAEFGSLSAEDEATRQVALAKEQETAAQKALESIAENTAYLKSIAEALTTEEDS